MTATDPLDVALAEILVELFAASEVEFTPGEGTNLVPESDDWIRVVLAGSGTVVGRFRRSELARRAAEIARART